MELKPFPHLIVDQIFTDTYYGYLLRNFINVDSDNTGHFKRRGAAKPRYSFKIDNTTSRLSDGDSGDKMAFWECHYKIYGGEKFSNEVLDAFKDVLKKRFQKRSESHFSLKKLGLDFFQSISLVQDLDNYFISPHKDVPEKIITNLFYIAPGSFERNLQNAGTVLLKPQNPRVLKDVRDICDLTSFQQKCKFIRFQGKYYTFKQCSFKANRLIAFAPCDSAWHAVPLQNLGNTPRNTIQSFIGCTRKFPLGNC